MADYGIRIAEFWTLEHLNIRQEDCDYWAVERQNFGHENCRILDSRTPGYWKRGLQNNG
jgi:hypothetical protein